MSNFNHNFQTAQIDENTLKRLAYIHEWTGEECAKIRDYLNLSQKTVATALDVTPATIANLENGRGGHELKLHYCLFLEKFYAYTQRMESCYRYTGGNEGNLYPLWRWIESTVLNCTERAVNDGTA